MQSLTDQITQAQAALQTGKATFSTAISGAQTKLTQQQQTDQKTQADALAAAQQTLNTAVGAGHDTATQVISQANQTYQAALTNRLTVAASAVAAGQDQLANGFRTANQNYQSQHQSALDGTTSTIDAVGQSLQSQLDGAQTTADDQINSVGATLNGQVATALNDLSAAQSNAATEFDTAATMADTAFGAAVGDMPASFSGLLSAAIAQRDAQLANLPASFITNFSNGSTYNDAKTAADTVLGVAIATAQSNLDSATAAAESVYGTTAQVASSRLMSAQNSATTRLQSDLQNGDIAEQASVVTAENGYATAAASADANFQGRFSSAQSQLQSQVAGGENAYEAAINQTSDAFKTSAATSLQTYMNWATGSFGTPDSHDPLTGNVIAGTLGSFQISEKQDATAAYSALQQAAQNQSSAFIAADSAYVTLMTAAETAYLGVYNSTQQRLLQTVSDANSTVNTARTSAQAAYDQAVQTIWASSPGASMSMDQYAAWYAAQQSQMNAAKRVYFSAVGTAEIDAAQTVGGAYVSAVGSERAARAVLMEATTSAHDTWTESRTTAQVALKEATDSILSSFQDQITGLEASYDVQRDQKLTTFDSDVANAEQAALVSDENLKGAFENQMADDLQQEITAEASAEGTYEHALEDGAQTAENQMADADQLWFNSVGADEAAWLLAGSTANTAYVVAMDGAEQDLSAALSAAQTTAASDTNLAIRTWQTSIDVAWQTAFLAANGSSPDLTAVAAVLTQFDDAINGAAASVDSGYFTAYQSYASAVVSAATAADEAQSAASTTATQNVATDTTSALRQAGLAFKSEADIEAGAEHSAMGAVSDAIQSFSDSENLAADAASHAMIGAATAYGSTVITTALQTFVGDLGDRSSLFGSDVAASVGYTESTIGAAVSYEAAIYSADYAALVAADKRGEGQLKSVLEANTSLATAGAAAQVATELNQMKASLQNLLQLDNNQLNQYSPDSMGSVVGGPMMIVDFTNSTTAEQLSVSADATLDEAAAIQSAIAILNDAANTTQSLRNSGVQTGALQMVMGSGTYCQAGLQAINDEAVQLVQVADNQFAAMAAKDEMENLGANLRQQQQVAPAPPKADDPVNDGSLTAGFVYYDQTGIAWVKRLIPDPQKPTSEIWYFRKLNEVNDNLGQSWTTSQWNAFFASGDRGAPATQWTPSVYNGGATESPWGTFFGALPGAVASTFNSGEAWDSYQGAARQMGYTMFGWAGMSDPSTIAPLFGNQTAYNEGRVVGFAWGMANNVAMLAYGTAGLISSFGALATGGGAVVTIGGITLEVAGGGAILLNPAIVINGAITLAGQMGLTMALSEHFCEWELFGPQGGLNAAGNELSGFEFSTNGRSFDFMEQAEFGHTEGKVIEALEEAGLLGKGKWLNLEGVKPPCVNCQRILKEISARFEMEISYIDEFENVWAWINGKLVSHP